MKECFIPNQLVSFVCGMCSRLDEHCCTVGRSEANHSKLEILHKRAAYDNFMITRFSWETPSEQTFEILS